MVNKGVACERQTYFRSSLLSLRKIWREVTTGNTSAVRRLLCKQFCGNLLFAVLFYSTGSQRLLHRRELEDLYGKV